MFVLVAMDYFIKWAEVKALANIRDMDVKKFLWRNIVTRPNIAVEVNIKEKEMCTQVNKCESKIENYHDGVLL